MTWMRKIVSKAFWRIILPFVLALVLAIVQIMEIEGRLRTDFFLGGVSLYGVAVLFCIFFGIAFRNTLRWAKEAEEYESSLREAAEIEKERRRRSTWIER